MDSGERIVRYTSEELEAMEKRGETFTNYAYLDALTEEELQASIDHDEEGVPDWSTVQKGIPGFQEPVTLRVDRDVIAWFASQGPGHEERMARVLLAYVNAKKD